MLEWVRVDTYNKRELKQFWLFCDEYFKEILADNPRELRYFLGIPYHHLVRKLSRRKIRPVVMRQVFEKGQVVAIALYQQDNDIAFIMEYGVHYDKRFQGLGSTLYDMLETELIQKGVAVVRLTPTTKGNEVFWRKMGYVRTEELAENQRFIYTKRLKER